MKLIYYRGLNCHLACIVNMIASLGVEYQNAFQTLWSESDFADEAKCAMYVSKRVLSNLEALGVEIVVTDCESNEESEECFSGIPQEESFLVGMDSFHIPWSPVYQNFHEPHYFFAHKEDQNTVSCSDPIYNQNNLRLQSAKIMPYAFQLSRIRMLPTDPPRFDVSREALDILRKHPKIQQNFLAEIVQYRSEERKNMKPLIRQINAMINNRYLYERYLHQPTSGFDTDNRFFSNDFFKKWEAIKNGLYKAYILKNNEGIIHEVCTRFESIIREETDMATEMAKYNATL